jgi:hypothetical protein
MKDDRVRGFRVALQHLIESLQATVRVSRWTESESIPAPLQESASQLVARLGAADRLVSKPFTGSPPDVARVTVMCTSMRRLDAAYVTYRQHIERAPSERDSAAMSLEAEIDDVKAEAGR